MASARAWKDEFTLLCERCGYVIEGLPTEGACPECGKPIVESLPERRVGTPWQRDPVARNLLRTWWMSLIQPVRTLDVLAEKPLADTRLRRWTLVASAFLFSIGYWQYGAIDMVREEPLTGLVLIGFVLICTLALWPFLLGLTLVETWGLGVISKARGFRTPLNTRRAITAHGCVGWLIAGIVVCVWTLGLDLLHTMSTKPLPDYDPDLPFSENLEAVFGRATPLWLDWLGIITRIACVLTGFLYFEIFAWLGLRRLKYANRVRPPDQPPADAAALGPPAAH